MNYITALPDFLEMQRVSFCWFIAQGLNEELAMFSRIHDFSYNTEYILFGDEYTLVKPIYNIVRAKKYTANYAAQLVIPLEIRNKKLNSVRYHHQFPIINLPLMTTSATFIINGCERVIVSQIIRSPGIYFEKNKNQKKRKVVKRILSTDINKLKAFVPLGEPFISEQILAFFPTAYNQSIFQYSFTQLKKSEQELYFYFLESFKIYSLISKTSDTKKKLNRIKLFLNWINLNHQQLSQASPFYSLQTENLLKEWQYILKSLIKFELLQRYQKTNLNKIEHKWHDYLLKKLLLAKLSTKRDFDDLNQYYKNNSNLNFVNKLLIVFIQDLKILHQINQFKSINKKILTTNNKFEFLFHNSTQTTLKPTFYFSTTLKELFKYKQRKKKTKDAEQIKVRTSPKSELNATQLNNIEFDTFNSDLFEYKYETSDNQSRLNYLKSRSEIIQYKDQQQICDNYKQKYQEKIYIQQF